MSGGIDLYDGLLVVGLALLGLAVYMESGTWAVIGYAGALLAVLGVALAWRRRE